MLCPMLVAMAVPAPAVFTAFEKVEIGLLSPRRLPPRHRPGRTRCHRARDAVAPSVGGPLALFDLWLVKDRALLKALLPPLATLATGMAAFASLYIAFIALNRRATGAWPYSMMDGLTTAPKFAMFAVGQIAVLTVFQLLVWGPLAYFG